LNRVEKCLDLNDYCIQSRSKYWMLNCLIKKTSKNLPVFQCSKICSEIQFRSITKPVFEWLKTVEQIDLLFDYRTSKSLALRRFLFMGVQYSDGKIINIFETNMLDHFKNEWWMRMTKHLPLVSAALYAGFACRCETLLTRHRHSNPWPTTSKNKVNIS
jgi:hypothetical protein